MLNTSDSASASILYIAAMFSSDYTTFCTRLFLSTSVKLEFADAPYIRNKGLGIHQDIVISAIELEYP
jgi:hypothetical protein